MARKPKWEPQVPFANMPVQGPASMSSVIEQMLAEIAVEVSTEANKETRYETAGTRTLRVTSVKHNQKDDHGEITITGKEADIRNLELMMMGVKWARLSEGCIDVSDAYHDLPEPVDDPKLKDHWPQEPTVTPGSRFEMFIDDPERAKQARSGLDNRSINVSGIQAYAPADVYAQRASMLEEAGFFCMRSQRDDTGKYWEIWHLPSPVFAKGPIEKKTVDEIVNWLMKSVGPGSISIEGTHWGAMLE
jgi:hypothetical protein